MPYPERERAMDTVANQRGSSVGGQGNAAGVRRVVIGLLPLWCVLLLLALTPPWLLSRDLWTDEAYTVSYANHASLADVLEDVRKNEETPPLSSMLVWLWARVAGPSVEAIRLLSLLQAMAAVGLFVVYSRRSLSVSEAVVAGVVLITSPLLGGYVLEARGYMLTLLLGVCCMVLFERLRQRPEEWRTALGYALAGGALLLTTYLGIALLLAHNIAWLSTMFRRRTWRSVLLWLAAQCTIAAAGLWWLPVLLDRLEIIPALTPYTGVTPLDHALVMAGVVMHGPVLSKWIVVWLAVSVAIWALMLTGAVAELRRGQSFVVRTFVLPAAVLLATLAAIEAVGPRYLMLLLPGAALATARGWKVMTDGAPVLARVLLCVVVGGLLLWRIPVRISQPQPAAWQPLAAYIAAHAQPDDVVLFQPPYDLRTFEYYYHGPALPLLGARHYDDFYYTQGHSFRNSWEPAEAMVAARAGRRVWVVQNPGRAAPKPDLPLALLDKHDFGPLALRLYALPAR
jgi:4-amino-4-deoxy-L-arabinose transferase-like glycosyltransferase